MQILNVGLGQQMQEIARKVVSLYYVANQIILSVESDHALASFTLAKLTAKPTYTSTFCPNLVSSNDAIHTLSSLN